MHSRHTLSKSSSGFGDAVGRATTRTARRLAALLALVLLPVVLVAPAEAAPTTVTLGRASFEPVNYAGRFVRHQDYLGRIDPVTSSSAAQLKSDATFTVVPGLASSSCYSFQATNGRFLRHKDYRVRLDTNDGSATFRADATFCAQTGSVTGSVSFTSYNFPSRTLRHKRSELWIDPTQDTAQFRADSSFYRRTPWTPRTTANPVLPGLFADPHLTYLNGRYYLYPTTDGYAGWSGPAYSAWSSADLTTWTFYGNVLDLGPDVSWADNSAWAPAVVAKNGRYYLYFSGGAASGNTAKQLGVAVADSPTGPFRDALGRPLVAAGAYSGQAIDPMVFTDDDGTSYLYWGQGALRVVPLNADLTSFDPARVRTITPSGYNEAPFLFERNGTYYLMWSENDTRSEDYRVAYATASSPTGPFTNRGVVLSKNTGLGILGTGHHSVVRSPTGDTWYIAYHRFAVPAGNGTNREVAIDRLTFRADGTIAPVVPTP
ncbi:family 43 glycosylhydrolase [Antribacter gilvus]|uniref:family 43 glycosylhydrolase n=1 Tax=Antribacter gilvus TaxID=2304675 RepID=UPI00197F9738|nr:family 43 glycosylhydrolase [Antribacter gilvus]